MAVIVVQAGANQHEDKLALGKPQEAPPPLLALPTHLLEAILSHRAHKKVIRLCCRHLRDVVDGMMNCANLSLQFNFGDRVQEAFLQRMQHQPRLAIVRAYIKRNQSHLFQGWYQPNLLDYMPRFATTLYLEGCIHDVEPLAALPKLTALSIFYRNPATCWSDSYSRKLWGLDKLQGLTSLQSNMRLKSLERLAPTLRRLEIEDLWQAKKTIKQLTNLELLYCGSLASYETENIKHLPLIHLGWDAGRDQDSLQCDDTDVWKHAPTTLTSIAVRGALARFAPNTMPTSIVSLQLFDTSAAVIHNAAQAMPWIKHLEISLYIWKHYYPDDDHRQAIWQQYKAMNCNFPQLEELHLFVSDRMNSVVNDWDTLAKYLACFDATTGIFPGHRMYLHPTEASIDGDRHHRPDCSTWV